MNRNKLHSGLRHDLDIFGIVLLGLAVIIFAFVAYMIVVTGAVLMALDILMTFLIVLSFWVLLVRWLTGEFPFMPVRFKSKHSHR